MTINKQALDYADTALAAGIEAVATFYDETDELLCRDGGAAQGRQVNVSWIENLTKTRERRDGEALRFDTTRAYGATYPLRTYYRALEIPRKRMQYGDTSKIDAAVSRFVEEVRSMRSEEIWKAILANSIVGTDGVVLFSASHPFADSAGGTYDNTLSTLLDQNEYDSVRQYFATLTRENDELANRAITHVFVGPSQERAAKEMLNAERIVPVSSTGVLDASANVVAGPTIKNVYEGDSTLVITNQLERDGVLGRHIFADLSTTDRPWYFELGSEETAGLSVIPMNDPDEVAKRDTYQWVVQMDMAQGPLHPQTVAGKLS